MYHRKKCRFWAEKSKIVIFSIFPLLLQGQNHWNLRWKESLQKCCKLISYLFYYSVVLVWYPFQRWKRLLSTRTWPPKRVNGKFVWLWCPECAINQITMLNLCWNVISWILNSNLVTKRCWFASYWTENNDVIMLLSPTIINCTYASFIVL